MTRTFAVLALLLAITTSASAKANKKAEKGSSPDSAAQTPAAKLVSGVSDYGYLNPETFAAMSTKSEQALGVRVGRVLHREEVPGGPWSGGEIGDYIIENSLVRVIVKSREGSLANSSSPFAPGDIVDIVLRDQNRDSFGGINQLSKINDENALRGIDCTQILIKQPVGAIKTPFLAIYGTVRGIPDLETITTINLEPNTPNLVVRTLFLNKGKKEYKVDILEKLNWGTLPIFVGGFGISRSSQAMQFGSQWISGALDDFCLSEVVSGAAPLHIVRLLDNGSYHLLGSRTLQPAAALQAERTFVVSRGDMAAASEFLFQSKGLPHGYIEGYVRQISDKKPVPGAEIQIRIFNIEEKSSNLSWQPYIKTISDEKGHYRVAVPIGKYAVWCKAIGRPLLPLQQAELAVNEPKTYTHDLQQADLGTHTFKVVDADTSQPIPAKVTFIPVGSTRVAALGAPWQAQGARNTYYLKPGPNKIPVVTGAVSGIFRCIFSRGPEYDIVDKEITFAMGKSQDIVIALKHVVPTPGMISVDLNLATRRSSFSRVSAEDMVLAAAGEGIEWVFSGDLNEATDFSDAIKNQGLEKFIRSSVGVHLSFQYPKLFGEFYVFPVPKGTTAATIKSLANPRTRPAEFFKAVRKTFPGAIIAVMRPTTINTSYLTYYNMDMTTGASPFVNDFSLDFDAIETHEGKETPVNEQNWKMMTSLLSQGHPKLPLASSLSTDLLYEEPGYARMYIVTNKENPISISEGEAIKAIRNGKYFITNGPIIEQYVLTDPNICEVVGKSQIQSLPMRYSIDKGKVSLTGIEISKQDLNEFWPNVNTDIPLDEFVYLFQVSAAPWVKTSSIFFLDAGNMARQALMKSTKEVVRFPFDKETRTPFYWFFHAKDPNTGKVSYRNSYISSEVKGDSLAPVVTRAPYGTYNSFAVTPPVLMTSSLATQTLTNKAIKTK